MIILIHKIQDIIMKDLKWHHEDDSLNYSLGRMDTCDSPKKKSPAKTSFRSVEDCKRNKHYGGRSIFDGTNGERDRFDGKFLFSYSSLSRFSVSWFIYHNPFSCIFVSFIFQISLLPLYVLIETFINEI